MNEPRNRTHSLLSLWRDNAALTPRLSPRSCSEPWRTRRSTSLPTGRNPKMTVDNARADSNARREDCCGQLQAPVRSTFDSLEFQPFPNRDSSLPRSERRSPDITVCRSAFGLIPRGELRGETLRGTFHSGESPSMQVRQTFSTAV